MQHCQSSCTTNVDLNFVSRVCVFDYCILCAPSITISSTADARYLLPDAHCLVPDGPCSAGRLPVSVPKKKHVPRKKRAARSHAASSSSQPVPPRKRRLASRKRPAASSSSSAPVSKYKHITYRATNSKGQQGYIVQYGGKTWGGYHSKESDACKALSDAIHKVTGKRPRSLPLRFDSGSRAQKPGKEAYWGVSYHKNNKRWVGNNRSLGKTFKTPLAAARALAALEQTPVTSLPAAQKRQQFRTTELLDRARKLIQWGEKSGLELWIPADLETTKLHASKSRLMFDSEPGLRALSLHMKYGPWKGMLLEVWQSHKQQFARPYSEVPLDRRAERLIQVASETAKWISKHKVASEWPQYCNRFRHREQGPSIVLRNLGVVKAWVFSAM